MSIVSHSLVVSLILVQSLPAVILINYEPNWDSLDSRPIPQWYDDAKFGVILHWGLCSLPGMGRNWLWHPESEEYSPRRGFNREQVAQNFTASQFNPDHIVNFLHQAGARYIVLTSKHYDGYTLWPSCQSPNWNSVALGPRRDLVGELSKAIKNKKEMHFGVYYSLRDLLHPLYKQAQESNFKNKTFVLRKVLPELKSLVLKYKPEIIWSEGEWEAKDEYWNTKQFLTWLFNESPVRNTVIINDRWAFGTRCHHGGVHTACKGNTTQHKWENYITMTNSWCYNDNLSSKTNYNSQDLIETLVKTVSRGGNLLLNVPPTKEGNIPVIYQEALKGIGQWLKLNGEAIYGTTYWIDHQDKTNQDVWYTQTKIIMSTSPDVFAIVLKWPEDTNTLQLGSIAGQLDDYHSEIYYIVRDKEIPLEWSDTKDGMIIQMPKTRAYRKRYFVLRITAVKNYNTKNLIESKVQPA